MGRAFGQLFSGVPLRAALARLGATAEVPIWLDRRVDGEQPVSHTASGATARQSLDAMVSQQHLAWVWVGEVPYVCRAADAPRLQTSYWQHAVAAKGLLTSRPPIDLQWTRPAEPRALLADFLSRVNIAVEASESPEHDLWAPASLRGIRPATAATLLLGGFDLQLVSRDSRWAVEPQGAADDASAPRLAWPYPADAIRTLDATRRETIEGRHAGRFEWRAVGERAWLNASAEMHREVQSAISKLSDTNVDPASPGVDEPRPVATATQLRGLERQRYDLRLRGPLGNVLPQIAAQIGLQIEGELEPALRDRVVEVSVSKASVDELMKEIAASAGCEIVREGLSLRVSER